MSNNLFVASISFSSKDKAGFFDRQEVKGRLGKGKQKALGKAAATCRKKIQQGIRRATSNKSSKPGKPPKQRMTGNDGLRKIYYSFDFKNDTVRLSVLKFNRKTNVTSLHEFGGTQTLVEREYEPVNEPARVRAFLDDRLKKTLKYYANRSRRRRSVFSAVSMGKVLTEKDFTLVSTSRKAKYPKRSYMQFGLEKYMKTKHFQSRVAEILKG